MNLLDLMVKIGVDDQATSKVGGIASTITGKLGKAAKVAGTALAGLSAAAGAGVVAIGKSAVESYAQYEQLVGGVDKLYQGASGKLQQYAQNAYKTSGMSANQYMEQATSFSAALINSLGGDVDKAADQTDKAMRLMSDNVNTFGSDAEAVQNAIQGLSRENYTMLDNLKLGYAGTKEGMQQLIDDANEYARQQGINADLTIGNFSDMIDAIDLIQQKQHIWGTTAKEAATTIEGSVTMTKAAWENFLTAIGTGDEDKIRAAVGGLVGGIFGTWDDEAGKRVGGIINNVAPVVQRVGSAILSELPSLASTIGYQLATLIVSAFADGADVDGIMTSLEDAMTTASDRIGAVLDGLGAAWESFSSTVDTGYLTIAMEHLQSMGEKLWGFIETSILPNMPAIGEAVANVANFLMSLGATLLTVMDNLTPLIPVIAGAVAAVQGFMALQGLIAFFTGLGGAITSLTTIVATFGGPIATIAAALGGWPIIIAAVVGAIVAFIASNEQAREAIANAWQAVCDFFAGLPEFFGGIWDSIKETIATAVADNLAKWDEFKANTGEKFEALKQAAIDKFTAIKQGISDRVEAVKQAAINKFNSMKDSVTNAFNTAKTNVTNAAKGIYDGIKKKFDDAVNFVKGIPQRIKNALGNLGNLLKSAGRSIISGLLSGLKEKFESVTSWVSGIAGTIASLKGPLPYDRTVLIENGKALMTGLQKGLGEGFEGEVKPYVSKMAEEISNGMSFGVQVPDMSAQKYVRAQPQQQMTVRDDAVVGLLTAILGAIPEEVTLDSKKLVGALAPDMNKALGAL